MPTLYKEAKFGAPEVTLPHLLVSTRQHSVTEHKQQSSPTCTIHAYIVISVSGARSHTERAACSAWSKPFIAVFS